MLKKCWALIRFGSFTIIKTGTKQDDRKEKKGNDKNFQRIDITHNVYCILDGQMVAHLKERIKINTLKNR